MSFWNSKLSRLGLMLLVLAATCVFLPGRHASALSASNYTSNLIDDAVMRDSGSMGDNNSGPQAIQSFLNNQGSGLAGFSDIEDCGSGTGSHYTYYATYYACGQRASAAQIIYAAGRAYSINPRVLLATMQKEQSLVTTPNPTASQLNYAMGYGCPDSGGCSYAGFFNQVDNAAWQFRTNIELANGKSWWGYAPSSYACNGPTRYYSTALKGGATVAFKDDNGTNYATIVLANTSTAAFYCYTPHVYNNPNGLYGNPQYGTTGQYYSGSYNFVKAFVNWWGSTYVPSFQATFAGQSNYPTIIRGQSSAAFLKYQNTGNQPWYDDYTSPAYHTYSVHLATSNPYNSGNPFSAFWPTGNRAATSFAHVYESDGVTLAANQHIAQPGQIVEFDFSFSVPSNTAPGYYQNFFQPVLEGSTLWNMGGVAMLGITVQPATFQATFAGQSNYPTIIRGQSSAAFLKYQNTGNQPWYDQTTAAQYNTYAVHLASTNPINSNNPFSAFWPGSSRAAINFARVYESDGTTLAANQHIAQPGQIVEFDFSFSVPSNTAPGRYAAYFQPILEGASNWNMGGMAMLTVTIQAPTFQATFAGQSNYPTIIRGQSSAAFLKYQNTGNQPWYDDSTYSGNSPGPVRLATTIPINTPSPFSATWPGRERAATSFAHVYESDGVTLAANQHIAQPGQIVEFDFSFSVPTATAPGTYPAFFQPILEGTPMWNLGGVALLNVTAQ